MRKARWVMGPALALVAVRFAACVGDSPTNVVVAGDGSAPADGATSSGSDGSTPSDATFDASSVDAPATGPCDPTKPFTSVTLLQGVTNTTADEQYFHLAAGGLLAVYQRTTDFTDGATQSSIYVTTRSSVADSFPTGTFSDLNDAYGADEVSFSGDGLTAYLSDNGRPGSTGLKLWTASRGALGNAFNAVSLVAGIQNSASQVHPYILPDSSAFYFDDDNSTFLRAAAAMGGGFAAGVPMPELSGAGQMLSPTVSDDELTIYWGTTREVDGGDGGPNATYDIWMATRASATSSFTNVHSVTELDTVSNERPSFISSDLCTLYFDSDRPSGTGGYDIWVATKSP